MLAHELKEAATRYFLQKNMAINEEVGVCKGGRYRADLLAMAMNGHITIIETKSSIADFRQDKKWKNYLDYSHRLYFCVDEELYEKIKSKIPKDLGVGFLVIVKHEKYNRVINKAVVKRRAKYREIPSEVALNLAIRMVFRNADHNRYKKRRR
jgi:hypothetical protein